MIVKDTLLKADEMFSKFELEGAVCYPSVNKSCCVSCKTDDDLVYLYVERFREINLKTEGEEESPSTDYELKEFGIRNWYPFHMMLNMCPPESLNLEIINDEYGYPQLAYFSYDNVKVKHHLQNYTFISNQNDLLNLYKQKRFELKRAGDNAKHGIGPELFKTMSKFSTMLNEKFFRVDKEGENLVLYYGDMNQSIDCASIKISAEYGANDVGDNSTYFNIDYFTTLYRSLGANEDVKIHFMKNKIIMATKDEHYYRVGVLVGKNM